MQNFRTLYWTIMSLKSRVVVGEFRPLKNNVFVTDLESGPQMTRGGIIVPDDNMKDRGIRSRWAKVFAIGPEVEGVQVGDWVLVEHGRWTPGIDMEFPDGTVRVWRIDWPDAVLMASEDDPRNATTHQF